MTLALDHVKSGTVAGFYNVAMILSFITDSIYFHRDFVISDFVGGAIIIVSTSFQGYMANKDNEAEQEKAKQNTRSRSGNYRGNLSGTLPRDGSCFMGYS